MRLVILALSKKSLLVVILLFALRALSQTPDSLDEPSSLPEVVIRAFEQNRKMKDVPAAVNYTGRQMFENFSSSSMVSAVNTAPGVRMEERSPGSYRLNIRGSSLRSPFGVRNIKIYYNDMPFTDPGGQSYLNQLGNANINSLEIIKGSNNSIYGAGTGGVMLIESISEKDKAGIMGEYGSGSYDLRNYNFSITTASEKFNGRYGFQSQKNDGYRDHSKISKSIVSWNGLFKMGRESIVKTTFLYSDLFYETPGALTLVEFKANPKSARPGNATVPGAVQANALIKQKSFLAGASYIQPITARLQNKTTLYGMFTELINPNLRNYEKSALPHFGGRTAFKFQQPLKQSLLIIDAGGEFQQGFNSITIHKNRNGNPDSLLSHDNINNQQSLIFLQSSFEISNWMIMAGASWNAFQVKFERFVSSASGKLNRKFNNEIAPRFSLMKKYKLVNIYASIAKGFSSPTIAEIFPTGGSVNSGLNAEEGITYELGLKGNSKNSMYFDINVFAFSLNNTIVQRRDAAGGDFFVNAGKTKQHGVETLMNYPFLLPFTAFKKSLFWISYTLHDFEYKEFKQLSNDFSGNKIPSVPQNTISTGINLVMVNGLFGGINYYYTDRIPLNDANSEYAGAYHLLGAQIGFEKVFKNHASVKITGGADNLLNQRYSLGNDINAFGGRYYNASYPLNFYISIIFRINTRPK